MSERLAVSHHSQRRRTGFTLMEMLVVVVIVGLVVAIAAPAIMATLKAGALGNAVNQVSAQLTVARSIAMRDNTDTAVVFFTNATDPENVVIEMRILSVDTVDTTVAAGMMPLTDIEDRPAEVLPRDIRMVGPDFFSGPDNVWLPPAPTNTTSNSEWWLAVWFAPDGTTRTSTLDSRFGMRYNLNNSGGFENFENAMPIPFLALYDQREYEKDSLPNLNDWINRNTNPQQVGVLQQARVLKQVRVLMFNRYTGVLMATNP